MPEGERWGQWPQRLSAALGPVAASVWADIRRRAGPGGGPVQVAIATVAASVGRSQRTVRRLLTSLEAEHWIAATRTGRESLLEAVVPQEEHIESGHEWPLRVAKNGLSEWPKTTTQSGQKRPLAPPLILFERSGEGEGETDPAPPVAPGGLKTAATAETSPPASAEAMAGGPPRRPPGPKASPSWRQEDPDLADLAEAFAARQIKAQHPDDILGVIAEDVRGGRYKREDLRLVIEGSPVIDALAYKFRGLVVPVAASIRANHLRSRLRAIVAGGRKLAWRRAKPSERARIESVDVEAGRIVLVAWSDGGMPDRRVIDSLDDLGSWAFASEDPTLYPLDEKPPTKIADCGMRIAKLKLPDDPVLRAAAEQLVAAIGRKKYSVWFELCHWSTGDAGEVLLEPPNLFVADYLRAHYLVDLQAAGVQLKHFTAEIAEKRGSQ